jgi:hypothetical protein
MNLNRSLAGILTGLLAAALIGGCATPVRSEYDQRANFDRFRSFAWVAPERDKVADPVLDSQLLDRRMRSAVQSELIARGYDLVSPDEADFLVTYHTSTRERIQPGTTRVSIGYHRGSPFWWGGTFADTGARSYREGTIIIDIIDRAEGTLVWRGWSASEVRQDRYTDDRLRRLTSSILKDFPPGGR